MDARIANLFAGVGIVDAMRAPRVAPDWIAFAARDWMGGPFTAFRSNTGIDGLAIMQGRRLDLLSVNAHDPGTGQFRAFITQAKLHCDEIGVWEIWNDTLAETLVRYGFKDAKRSFTNEKPVAGMEWKR